MRAAALSLLCACATASGGPDSLDRGLTFIEDDYTSALAEARARDVPLFIDAWAPWCHSCVFLREHVMRSPELAHAQKRFVFLSVNTELARSAPILEKFPIEAWPTLLVVAPNEERAVLKWLGTGTVEQLEKLFDDGEAAARAGTDPLAAADRLYAQSKDSADAYRAALAQLPDGHPRRPRAVESLINALMAQHDLKGCAEAGVALASKLPRGPSFVNAVALSLSCAAEADA
jgi:thioredoxin-like negative regulator of GroEL